MDGACGRVAAGQARGPVLSSGVGTGRARPFLSFAFISQDSGPSLLLFLGNNIYHRKHEGIRRSVGKCFGLGERTVRGQVLLWSALVILI